MDLETRSDMLVVVLVSPMLMRLPRELSAIALVG